MCFGCASYWCRRYEEDELELYDGLSIIIEIKRQDKDIVFHSIKLM